MNPSRLTWALSTHFAQAGGEPGRVGFRHDPAVARCDDAVDVDRHRERTAERAVGERCLRRVRDQPRRVGREHERRPRVEGADSSADLLLDPREEVVAQVDLVLEEVLQRGGVRGVVDVHEVAHRHPEPERPRRPPAGAAVPLERLRAPGPRAVGERPRADHLRPVVRVTGGDLRGAVPRPDMPGHDRDLVHVGVPLLVVRYAAEVERDDVALRRDPREARLPHRGVLRALELAGLERELDVGGGQGPPVAEGDAPAEGHDVVASDPPLAGREPREELVLQWVVAEQRLVEKPDDPGVVVGPERVEVRVRAPLLARRVQRLRSRERERRLLARCRSSDGQRDEGGDDGERRDPARSPSCSTPCHGPQIPPRVEVVGGRAFAGSRSGMRVDLEIGFASDANAGVQLTKVNSVTYPVQCQPVLYRVGAGRPVLPRGVSSPRKVSTSVVAAPSTAASRCRAAAMPNAWMSRVMAVSGGCTT